MISADAVHAGQAAYKGWILTWVYDALVLGFSNHVLWKCPTAGLLDLYNANVTSNHLDVGVGTGYYLDRCRFPDAEPRLALMDLNENSLSCAAKRVARRCSASRVDPTRRPTPRRCAPTWPTRCTVSRAGSRRSS